jgi:hypothetical protein
MNPAANFWIDATMRALTTIATIAVAGYVALISKRQWKNNQEKLRLDLYQHRFGIYQRVLEYHWALLEWEGKPEQLALRGPFVAAFCESKFMFPKASGVYEFLSEFNLHAFRIATLTHDIEEKEKWETVPGYIAGLAQQKIQSQNWILSSIETLLARMGPFLNFHSL